MQLVRCCVTVTMVSQSKITFFTTYAYNNKRRNDHELFSLKKNLLLTPPFLWESKSRKLSFV